MRYVAGGALLIGAAVFLAGLGPLGILGLAAIFIVLISLGDEEN